MNYTKEQSYYLDVLIDIGDDELCYISRFRFETTELAKQFIRHIETGKSKNCIVTTNIYSESDRYSTINRPSFSDITLAIEDLEKCVDYCYDTRPYKKYKYEDTIILESLTCFMLIFLENKNKQLQEENKQLQEENKQLQEENKQLKNR